MQDISHFVTGVIITAIIWRIIPDSKQDKHANTEISLKRTLNGPKLTAVSSIRFILILVLSFFSHALVDTLAIFTYHSGGIGDSIFDTIWYVSMYLAEALFAIYALQIDYRYAAGIFGAIWFDLWDWTILRAYKYYKPGNYWDFHRIESALKNFLFPNFTPLYSTKWAIIIEICYFAGLILLWLGLSKRWKIQDKAWKAPWWLIITTVIIVGVWLVLSLIIPS